MTAITVKIGATLFPSYATQAQADAYLLGDVEWAATWSDLLPDEKARGLASATRTIQRLPFLAGAPATDDASVPDAVRDACSVLAAVFLATPAAQSNPSTGSSNVRAVGAGPAKVEFFKPTKGAVLPPVVWALVKDLLGDGGSTAVGRAYGTDATSLFDDDDYRRGSFN